MARKNEEIRDQLAARMCEAGEENPQTLTCNCSAHFDEDRALCNLREFHTSKSTPRCEGFIAKVGEDLAWH